MTTQRNKSTQRNNHRNELIRHHCEEISTHLGALKQLHPSGEKYYTKIGRAIKTIHSQHGGHPDA